ncbi:MAG: hypothetical protein RLZZ337_1676 [Bacteroidota bacterium]|jgi:hypothetical protein
MKILFKTSIIIALIFAQFGCSEDVEPKLTGKLQFKMINPIASQYNKQKVNPPLTGKETVTKTISFNVCIGDVWVSKNEVKEGITDKPDEWIRLTSFTNTEHRLFEEYTFPEVEIPIGEYKSVHITFRNVFYRYAVLESDSNVFYELLETMGSWTEPCSLSDTSWVDPNTNYFSFDGNHIIDTATGKYVLEVEGEKLTGFTIDANKTAVVSWRLGAGVNEPCTTTLHDVNDNRIWDCGIDTMSFWCPPEVKYMWDFVVEYK